MKRWAIIAGCAVAAAVAIWLTLFRPSEEDRIRDVLNRFAKSVAIKRDDTLLSRAGRIKSELKETVADDVYVDVADFSIRVSTRKDLAEKAIQAPAVYTTADCELMGMTIKVDDSRTSAKVDALALVKGERGGDRKVDKRPVHFLLRNDGAWKITTIDVGASRAE